jgi:hypothetical protein
LITAVHAVVSELAGENAPAHVGAGLLKAFREHTPVVAENNAIPMRRRTPRHWRLEAVPAVILILVSVVTTFWLYSRSANQKQEQQVAVLTPSSEPAGTTVNYDPQPAPSPSTSHAKNRVRRQHTTKHSANAGEEVTEFFPLMDGIDLDSLEAVQAVRIELPASALVELGLQAGPGVPAGPLKADVLLGYDGLPRAIRFVR